MVGKFVEFFGEGLDSLGLATRATIANMAPEYGATIGYFPVDEISLEYLKLSGRDEKLINTVRDYYKKQGLFRDNSRKIEYGSVLELDLGEVEPSLSGPKRPQDRILLSKMSESFNDHLELDYGRPPNQQKSIAIKPLKTALKDGDIAIAAITSCTNTSNPYVMIAAGLLAKKAVLLGLRQKKHVKTSLAPGSKVVTNYLKEAGLSKYLDKLGFNTVGYGCTTCIGNSGPLKKEIREAIHKGDIVASSVLSGNRNFEGRISPDVKANYLASPPLVVVYAIAGSVKVDISREAIDKDKSGNKVYLKDIWPSDEEIEKTVKKALKSNQFKDEYRNVFKGAKDWEEIKTVKKSLYSFNLKSTYVKNPPFFTKVEKKRNIIKAIKGARCLLKLGDSVTTDHISPAGNIAENSPAGKYLTKNKVPKASFNSYGSRRGNDEVMTRGTFANIRVKNELAKGREGGFTRDFTRNRICDIYKASQNYKKVNTPLIVLAGKDYGMGSSRDWAAKGTFMLGVRAVISESFERIHRSNLVGMGVLPLNYLEGENAKSIGIDGTEIFDIEINDSIKPGQKLKVKAKKESGKTMDFFVICRIDTPIEVEYYRDGGILHHVLRKMAKLN